MDPDSLNPPDIELDADGLPVHAKDLKVFSQLLQDKPLAEKLRLLALATTRLTRDADKAFGHLPLPPSLDYSRMSVAQKIAAGNLMGEKLAKITANIPRLRELELLDAQSDFDDASHAAATSALARIQAASRQ